MTLPEVGENMAKENKNVIDVGQSLKNVLLQAVAEHRLTLGVFECAQILEVCPEEVMVCVLPYMPSNDVAVSIQHKLIEAHCWENGINVFRVDSSEKLTTLLSSGDVKGDVDRTYDMSCIAVKFPLEELSPDDHLITRFSYAPGETLHDVVELPA
ncbi:hypothetical protein ACJMK2_041962 [Sinanodonta woodiana]|uniref:Ribosomal protein eL8/eL30/eS12/Gadd45 domain-containing protein n=1 Tax=Sinanodonta woodiana TaxID=1069815 RepID=A0ABD3W5T6_SINWO